MKKSLLVVLFAMMMVVVTACGGSKQVSFSISTAVDTIKTEGAFTDTLTKCDSDKALSLYGLDGSILAEFEVHISTGATAEEIAIFRVKDTADMATVVAACEKRCADQVAACKDYLPDEIDKLNQPIMIEAGNYVIFVVCDDHMKTAQVVNTKVLQMK